MRVYGKPAGSNPQEGDAVEFLVTVKNVGAAPAPAGWYVDYYLDGKFVKRDGPAIALGAGASVVSPLLWEAPEGSAGKHTLKVVVDPTNVVSEGNEGNNEKSLDFIVEPRILPDLTVIVERTIEVMIVDRQPSPPLAIVEKNVGGADAGMHTDRVIITIEGIRLPPLVKERRHSLRAGESSQLPLPEMPSLSPGEYKAKITVALDVLNEVKESNEQNNVWEGVITIVIPPPLTVVSPNGGEVWLIGSTQTIKWEWKVKPTVMTSVKIDLSRDGGRSWETIIPGTIDDGSEPWIVTGPPTERALIRVTSLSIPGASDTSDRAFAIVLKGDMNRDGRLGTGDATIMLRKVVGLEPTSPEDVLIGDMNGDGSLDSGDATIILKRVVGLE